MGKLHIFLYVYRRVPIVLMVISRDFPSWFRTKKRGQGAWLWAPHQTSYETREIEEIKLVSTIKKYSDVMARWCLVDHHWIIQFTTDYILWSTGHRMKTQVFDTAYLRLSWIFDEHLALRPWRWGIRIQNGDAILWFHRKVRLHVLAMVNIERPHHVNRLT